MSFTYDRTISLILYWSIVLDCKAAITYVDIINYMDMLLSYYTGQTKWVKQSTIVNTNPMCRSRSLKCDFNTSHTGTNA